MGSRARRVGMLAALVTMVVMGASADAAFQPVVRDPTFATATGGLVTMHPGRAPRVHVEELIALPDGSVLVHLLAWTDPLSFSPATWVAKLRPDGSPDPAFAAGGATPGSVRVAPEGFVGDMAIDSQGRIIVAAGNQVMWLLADGTPDPSIEFCPGGGCPGWRPADPGVSFAAGPIVNIAVVAGDAVVAAAASSDFATIPLRLTKLNRTGEPVAGFGSGPFPGVAETSEIAAGQVVARADGRLLVFLTTGRPRILAFTSDGDPDPTYGNGTGSVALPVDDDPTSTFAIVPYPGDRYLISTYGSTAADAPATVHLISPDGVLDPTFGDGGHVDLTSIGGNAFTVFVPQPDGRIVVAVEQPDRTVALTRLTASGLLDASFGASVSPGWLALGLDVDSQESHTVPALTLDGGRLLVASTLMTVPSQTAIATISGYVLPTIDAVPYQRFRLSDGPPRPTGIDLPAEVEQPATRLRTTITD